MSLNFEMNATIRFNRPIDLEKDYITPGGYSMTMDGKKITFDFEDYIGNVDEKDPTLLHTEQYSPDDNYIEDNEYEITQTRLRKIEDINEFFVYVGEKGETDLRPVAVEKITFILPDNNTGILVVLT